MQKKKSFKITNYNINIQLKALKQNDTHFQLQTIYK